MEADYRVLEFCQCPKCDDLMLPPIQMCLRGHTICNGCIMDTRGCPLCRESDRGVRNLEENVMRPVYFRCPNKSIGCDYVDLGTNLKEHLVQCRRMLGGPCPLRDIALCKWKGKKHEVIDHCLKEHKRNCFRTNKQQLVCTRIRRGGLARPINKGATYHILFEAYGQMFKMIWDINADTGFLRFMFIAYTENKEDANKYQYTVEFKSTKPNQRDVRISGFCQTPDINYFEHGTYRISHIDLIKGFSHYYGIYYRVTINRSDQLTGEGSVNGINYIYHPDPVRYFRNKEDGYE